MAEYDKGNPMPKTNQPLNAEPRGTVGPVIATLLVVAVIVGLFLLTIWSTGLS